jgi:hypothetical protein
MLTRRGLLRTALGAAGAMVAAMAVGKVQANGPALKPGVRMGSAAYLALPPTTIPTPLIDLDALPAYDHSLPSITLNGMHTHSINAAVPAYSSVSYQSVTGPDPSAIVNVEWGPDGRVAVIPRDAPSPWPNRMVRGTGIPVGEFPEFNPKNGTVILYAPGHDLVPPDEWTVPMIRAHYVREVARSTPDIPYDWNHLSVRFMPKSLLTVQVTLDGEEASHVSESYDAADGWIVQYLTDDSGRVTTFGVPPRPLSRIRTGKVEHWRDGLLVGPGNHTAMLPYGVTRLQ